MEPNWVYFNAALPSGAVLAGYDIDRSPLFVGRAFHEGNTVPAKVRPNHNQAHVAWNGNDLRKIHFEVLVGHGYDWVGGYSDGRVPSNAVPVGNTHCGETLFVGRAHHANSLSPGHIYPSHGCLYIPFGDNAVRITSYYEVLVGRSELC